jgi:Tol biopolymer transport system component
MWTVEDGILNRSAGIYTISVSGGKPKVVAEGDAREPSWSPDSSKIAYTGITPDESRNIWCANADGGGAVNLTKGKGDCYNPAWSPALRRK